MNNKKKWTKSISVTLLVVLASVVTTGLVLADHFPPVGGVAVNSLTSFEQYQAAIDHYEEIRNAAFTSLSVRKVKSLTLYEQYMLDEMRREQEARTFQLAELSVNNVKSLDLLEQYNLDEYILDEMRREQEARTSKLSKLSVDTMKSLDLLEQYNLDEYILDEMRRELEARTSK